MIIPNAIWRSKTFFDTANVVLMLFLAHVDMSRANLKNGHNINLHELN